MSNLTIFVYFILAFITINVNLKLLTKRSELLENAKEMIADDEFDEEADGNERNDLKVGFLYSPSNGDKKRLVGGVQRSGPKIWDHWGKWSSCSSTCGVGKITRWRHCVAGGCATGEKEAQIKTCTLPAC